MAGEIQNQDNMESRSQVKKCVSGTSQLQQL